MSDMEKYINAVRRRLNLPKDVKERVMSDFVSSIRARQEAGRSDEAILSELGDAKKAAADLNEQMKEFAYRKSPWRFAFAALAAYGALRLVASVWAQIVYWVVQEQVRFSVREAATIGVIGGADGPTAIFVTAAPWTEYLVTAAFLLVGILGYLRLRKCK